MVKLDGIDVRIGVMMTPKHVFGTPVVVPGVAVPDRIAPSAVRVDDAGVRFQVPGRESGEQIRPQSVLVYWLPEVGKSPECAEELVMNHLSHDQVTVAAGTQWYHSRRPELKPGRYRVALVPLFEK